jgi:hypothetical protein
MSDLFPSHPGSRRLLGGAWIGFALAALLSLWAGVQARQDWDRVRRQVLAQEMTETRRAAGQVAELMARVEGLAADLARDLERAGGGPEALGARLEARLSGAPAAAVALQVWLPGRMVPLGARRGPSGVHPFEPEADGQAGSDGWSEPRLSRPDDRMVVDYVRDLRLPEGLGQVRVTVSLEEVQKLLRQLLTQAQGYGYLLSAKGAYLADPKGDRVRSGRTAFQVAEETRDPGRLAVAEAARDGRSAFVRSHSGVGRKPAWIILEPVHRGGWALAAVLLEEELPLMPADWRQDLARLTTFLVAMGWAALFLAFRGHRMEARSLRRISLGWSLLLLAGIGVLFRAAYLLPTRPLWEEIRIMEPLDLRDFEQRQRRLRANFRSAELQFIPTGVFLHTLESAGPDMMKMTGQIWQIYPKTTPPAQRGVTLPEAVHGEVHLEHRFEREEGSVQLYSFKATVREELDRTDLYPLDRTRIRLRLWPKPFFHNQALVPDLWGYSVLAPAARPGVDQEIELPGWDITSTEFAYVKEPVAQPGDIKFVNQTSASIEPKASLTHQM